MQNVWYIQPIMLAEVFADDCQTMQNVWYIQLDHYEERFDAYCLTMQNAWYRLFLHVIMKTMTGIQTI